MQLSTLPTVLAAAFVPWTAAVAQTDAVATEPRALDERVEQLRESHGLPALAGVLIDREGRVLVGGTAGTVAADSDAAIGPDAPWHIGSCTKAFTATLAAMDVAAGRLSWNSSPAAVLRGLVPEDDPDWKPDPSWGTVTLGQLLSHTGSAPSAADVPVAWLALAAHEGPPREARAGLVRTLLARPLSSSSGERFLYSNLGYAIAGAMLETVGEGSFEERLQRELLAPLGVTGAGFGPPPSESAPIGHAGRPGAFRPVGRGRLADNPAGIAPAGTLHMPLADWARFVALHLRRGSGPDDPVGPEVFDELHRVRLDSYGLGWMVVERSWSDGPVLHHAGSNTFWFASVWAAPTEGFAALAVTNAAGQAAERATDALIGELLERRPEPVPAGER